MAANWIAQVQNKKTGKLYDFLGFAENATNGRADINEHFAVYKDGDQLYVRQRSEFEEKFQSFIKENFMQHRRVRVIHPDLPDKRPLYWALHELLKDLSERFAVFAGALPDTAEFYVVFRKPWTEEFAMAYLDEFGHAPTVLPIPYQYDHLLETSQVWPPKKLFTSVEEKNG